jgi:acyl-[acyl-carrier-protein] desaturase
VLRDYLVVTRSIDPMQLERGRMRQVMTGYDRGGRTLLEGMAYVSFQELATRISHRNTGRYSDDAVADRIMARVAADENLHMVFYRDMLHAALELDPSAAVKAIAVEVLGFQMPGAGMREFDRKAVEIAKAGIYDLRVHHDDVLWPLLRHWDFFGVDGLDAEADKARTQVSEFLDGLDAMARKYEAKRAEREARQT